MGTGKEDTENAGNEAEEDDGGEAMEVSFVRAGIGGTMNDDDDDDGGNDDGTSLLFFSGDVDDDDKKVDEDGGVPEASVSGKVSIVIEGRWVDFRNNGPQYKEFIG